MKAYGTGFTTGVFDLFHVGHLNLLERCKERCDQLIVAVCDDDYVRSVKHKEPVMTQEDRMRIIGNLKCVDRVVPITVAEDGGQAAVAGKSTALTCCFPATTGRGANDTGKRSASLPGWVPASNTFPIPTAYPPPN